MSLNSGWYGLHKRYYEMKCFPPKDVEPQGTMNGTLFRNGILCKWLSPNNISRVDLYLRHGYPNKKLTNEGAQTHT